MPFNITYKSETPIDFLPGNNTLAKRIRVHKNQGQISFLDRLKAGLTIISLHIWTIEKADPQFFSFTRTNTADAPLTETEMFNQLLARKLQQIFNDENEVNKTAKSIKLIAIAKTESDMFVIPCNVEEEHNYEFVTDQNIANLLQTVVIDDLPNVLKLLN